MNSRERVLKTLRNQEPDRIPLYMTITPELAAAAAGKLVIPAYSLADSPLSQNRILFHEILTRLGNDAVGIEACSSEDVPVLELGFGLRRGSTMPENSDTSQRTGMQ